MVRPIDVTVTNESTTYRQAVLNLDVSQTSPIGNAQLVISKSGQTSVSIDIRIAERREFIADTDTVLLWNLNENLDGVVSIVDSGTLSIDGTSNPNSTATVGRFAGGRSRAAIVAENDLNATYFNETSFTVETWFKTSPVTRDYVLIGRGDNSSLFGRSFNSQYLISLSPTGAIQARAWNSGNVLWQATMPQTDYTVDDNQWHLVTMVVDEDLDQMKLYIDGVLRATTNKPSNFGAIRNNSNWRVQAGRYNYDGSGAGEVEFPGILDDVRISSTAHTAERVAQDAIGFDELRVARVNPTVLQKGVTSRVKIIGNGLENATVTSNNVEVATSIISSSLSELVLDVTVSASAQIGQTNLTINDSTGGSVNTDFTIVNQAPFTNDAQTVLLWRLNESANGAIGIIDLSSNSIDGTSNPNSTATVGRFAGGRSRAAIVAENDLNATYFNETSFTVETWFKTSPVTRDYVLIGRGDNSSLFGRSFNSQYLISLSPTGAIQARAWNSGNTPWVVQQPRVYDVQTGYWQVDVTDNQWHLVTDGCR